MNTKETIIIFSIFSICSCNVERFHFPTPSAIISVVDVSQNKSLRTILNIPPPFNSSEEVKYETHEELKKKLNNLAAKFPSLAVTNSIGLSVEGRELRYIKITKDANKKRSILKPMVKFIGNIHGDETVGRQMLQYLAQHILHHYQEGDPLIQFLVNNTEILLLPDMNPDGFNKSTPGPRPLLSNDFSCPHSTPGRPNANGIDLNRDFPSTWTDRKTWDGNWTKISAGRQLETKAVMDWTFNNPFVLSANFHSGALVASYTYDTLRPTKRGEVRRGVTSKTPDDKLFRKLAMIYSENNIDMYNQRHENPNEQYCLHKCSKGYGGPFSQGVTNGAEWYNLEGGMQDFNYAYTNCMEITLELSCCKYPPPSLLKDYWKHNRNSLIYYTEAAHFGVKGLINDAEGQPISGASIKVEGNKKPVTTTERGEYWRLLLPGNYTLTASAQIYISSTISIHIPEKTVADWSTPKTAQRQDFILLRKGTNTNNPTLSTTESTVKFQNKTKVLKNNNKTEFFPTGLSFTFDDQPVQIPRNFENKGLQNNQNKKSKNNENKQGNKGTRIRSTTRRSQSRRKHGCIKEQQCQEKGGRIRCKNQCQRKTRTDRKLQG